MRNKTDIFGFFLTEFHFSVYLGFPYTTDISVRAQLTLGSGFGIGLLHYRSEPCVIAYWSRGVGPMPTAKCQAEKLRDNGAAIWRTV